MSLTDKLRNIGMGIALAGALGGAFSDVREPDNIDKDQE